MSATKMVTTAAGEIAVLETRGDGPTVMLIHGNSAHKEAWAKQYDGPLGARYRMVALDLPGHGASDDAADPDAVYSMPGYASVVVECLAALRVGRCAVVGWSLGGHVGIELIDRLPEMAGLLITGAPPVSNASEADVVAGFHLNDTTALFGTQDLDDAQIETLVKAAMGTDAPPAESIAAARRTDGRARSLMFGSFLAGRGADQKAIVESAALPVAVINGAADPLINRAFYETVRFASLWDGAPRFLEGVGHAPFWTDPDAFDPLLARFLAETLEPGSPI